MDIEYSEDNTAPSSSTHYYNHHQPKVELGVVEKYRELERLGVGGG